MKHVRIIDSIELPYVRQGTLDTPELLERAALAMMEKTGIAPSAIDGLGVSSFTYAPDRALDLAWRLSLPLRWMHDDSNGGISGLTLLQHAAAAIETGQAGAILLVAGDHFDRERFTRLLANYNRTTQEWLQPIGAANPNLLFSLLTQRHAQRHGLTRADYGAIAVAQRAWAIQHPQALYPSAMSTADYLSARMVSDQLCLYDCVPVVDGANAILLAHEDHPVARQGKAIRIRALAAMHNHDHQSGDGLQTGLHQVAPELWRQAGLQPDDIDVLSVYDDYPVMVLAQLQDLGFIQEGDIRRYIHEEIATHRLALNTSGGQLSRGQAGTAGSMHGLTEVIRQLRQEAGPSQVGTPRYGLSTGYGMIEYRYCMGATACVMEAA